MSQTSLLEEGRSYTFRSYFEMPYETDEILAAFGIAYSLQELELPKRSVSKEIVEPLAADLKKRIKRVQLSSETARRETLVSPVLFEIAELSDSQIRIEYSLTVDEKLKGKLDYLIRGQRSLLVVEAKNDNLTRGFTQLAVELTALSKKDDIREKQQEKLFGAVTIGNVWLFGCLDIEQQKIIQDTRLYTVPEALDDVMAILWGVLEAPIS